ncbi:MAG: substrate-binding domain-containing protein, partial [Chloroflexota bacterium]|nr:substrate-binding domain-containing protein [Chloroflexota bacterium]
DTPGDWDINIVSPLWQDLLQRFPDVKGGYFHSDDMALAAAEVVSQAGMQDQVKIVGVDGLRNACDAILADRLLASVINPTGRIHGGAVWVGYLTASGTDKNEGEVPKFIRTDGGPITIDNAPGYIWLGENLLY